MSEGARPEEVIRRYVEQKARNGYTYQVDPVTLERVTPELPAFDPDGELALAALKELVEDSGRG